MSILDDAIREHLELKRAHGADDDELKRLEDEAFGPPQRPDEIDPFAEAPTEFLLSPGDSAAAAPEVADEHARSGRRPDIADLQEGPPAPTDAAPAPTDAPPPTAEDELSPAPDAPPPSPADAAFAPPPPPADEVAADLAPPAEDVEEHPAGEHEIVPDAGPNTEERHAIADQPTQMFDVEAEMGAAPALQPTPTEQASPTDEQLVDAAREEPHAAPPAPEEPDTADSAQLPLESRGPDAEVAGRPPAEAEPTEEESAEFDFFNEQRLSDELDQALEAPITDEAALPGYEEAPGESGIFDFESRREPYEEDPSEEVLRRADAAAAAEQPSEEAPLESTEEAPRPAAEPSTDEPPSEELETDYDPDTGHEDVLEDTPRFLEDAPEDDDLWFEQKPPKDFDLD